jgi:hypothetical protein
VNYMIVRISLDFNEKIILLCVSCLIFSPTVLAGSELRQKSALAYCVV